MNISKKVFKNLLISGLLTTQSFSSSLDVDYRQPNKMSTYQKCSNKLYNVGKKAFTRHSEPLLLKAIEKFKKGLDDNARNTFFSTGDYVIIDGKNVPVISGINSTSRRILNFALGDKLGMLADVTLNKLSSAVGLRTIDEYLISNLSSQFGGPKTFEELIAKIIDSASEKIKSIVLGDSKEIIEEPSISFVTEKQTPVFSYEEQMKYRYNLELEKGREDVLISSIKTWSSSDLMDYIVHSFKEKINELVFDNSKKVFESLRGDFSQKAENLLNNVASAVTFAGLSSINPALGFVGGTIVSGIGIKVPEFASNCLKEQYNNCFRNIGLNLTPFSMTQEEISKNHFKVVESQTQKYQFDEEFEVLGEDEPVFKKVKYEEEFEVLEEKHLSPISMYFEKNLQEISNAAKLGYEEGRNANIKKVSTNGYTETKGTRNAVVHGNLNAIKEVGKTFFGWFKK